MKRLQFLTLLAFLSLGLACEKESLPALEAVNDVCTKIPDENLRALCYEAYDANLDGRVSMNEASAVTAISNYYRPRNSSSAIPHDFYSFEGIEYFTGLREIGIYFSKVETIDVSAAPPLSRMEVNQCHQLKKIVFPERVNKDFHLVYHYVSLEELSLPEGMTKLANSSILSSELKKLCLPSTLETIEDYAIEGIGWEYELTVLAKTPPSVGEHFPKPSHLYVPAESVEAYKKAWSRFADVISAIEE